MSKNNNLMPVTVDDLAFIFNNNMDDFYLATAHCYCMHCDEEAYESTITGYTIQLNNIYDIVLNGICLKCNNKIGRYIETGDNAATAKNAEAVWNTNNTLKELKIKRAR